jgi:hypothetical protein
VLSLQGHVLGSVPARGMREDHAPGLQIGQIVAHHSRVEPDMERVAGIAPWMQGGQTTFAAESLSPMSSAWTLPAYAAFLSEVLPVDFAALESSIKDFFDQIDQLGLTLTESQVDALFTTGMVAVAAAVAAEISRRSFQPSAAPVLALGRCRLPYSDYP